MPKPLLCCLRIAASVTVSRFSHRGGHHRHLQRKLSFHGPAFRFFICLYLPGRSSPAPQSIPPAHLARKVVDQTPRKMENATYLAFNRFQKKTDRKEASQNISTSRFCTSRLLSSKLLSPANRLLSSHFTLTASEQAAKTAVSSFSQCKWQEKTPANPRLCLQCSSFGDLSEQSRETGIDLETGFCYGGRAQTAASTSQPARYEYQSVSKMLFKKEILSQDRRGQQSRPE